MNINELTTNVNSRYTERVFDDLTSELKKGCSNNSAYNDLSNALEKNCKINNVDAVNYLYSPYSRGGGFNKNMNNTNIENFCNTCNGNMKGGCFTCVKGKTTLNINYNIIVKDLPKLYKKYKLTKNKKSVNNRKKGGDIFEANSSIKMDDISNFKYLHLDKYVPYAPFDINSQISLLG